MTLNIKKIREMFWVFGYILPINTEEHKEAIKVALGHGLEEIIPDLMIVLSQYAERSPEDFEMFCEFIVEALAYMRDKRKKHPLLDNITQEEYQQEMEVQIGRFTKSEKRKTQVKYEKLQKEAPEVELEKDR